MIFRAKGKCSDRKWDYLITDNDDSHGIFESSIRLLLFVRASVTFQPGAILYNA